MVLKTNFVWTIFFDFLSTARIAKISSLGKLICLQYFKRGKINFYFIQPVKNMKISPVLNM